MFKLSFSNHLICKQFIISLWSLLHKLKNIRKHVILYFSDYLNVYFILSACIWHIRSSCSLSGVYDHRHIYMSMFMTPSRSGRAAAEPAGRSISSQLWRRGEDTPPAMLSLWQHDESATVTSLSYRTDEEEEEKRRRKGKERKEIKERKGRSG